MNNEQIPVWWIMEYIKDMEMIGAYRTVSIILKMMDTWRKGKQR